MKRFLLFLLTFTSLCSILNAQETHFSKVQKFNGDKDQFSIGGWVQENLMIFYTEKGESLLDIYDQDMNRKAIVALGFMPNSPNSVELLPQKNQCLVLYSAQLNSKEAFYAARLDKDARIIGRPKKLEEASQNFFGNSKFDYQFIHNTDNTRAGVFAYRIKDGFIECQVNVVDDSLNVIQNSSLKVPTKKYYGLDQVILKEDGSLLLLLTDKSTNNNNEVAEAIVYHIVLQELNKTTTSAYPIDFGTYFTGNIFLKEDFSQANSVYFAGLTKDRKGISNGVFSGKIDLTAPNNQSFAGVSTKFSGEMNSLDKKNSSQLNDFDIQELVIKNDGGLLLIAEAFQKVYRTNYSAPMYYNRWGYQSSSTSRYTEYYYGDILTLDLDNQQKILDFSRIPKFQRSVDDLGKYSSFSVVNTGSQLGFLYNELSTRNNRLVVSFLENDLQPNTLEIATKAGMVGQWIPKRAKQIKSKEVILPIVDGKKLQFLKVNF